MTFEGDTTSKGQPGGGEGGTRSRWSTSRRHIRDGGGGKATGQDARWMERDSGGLVVADRTGCGGSRCGWSRADLTNRPPVLERLGGAVITKGLRCPQQHQVVLPSWWTPVPSTGG